MNACSLWCHQADCMILLAIFLIVLVTASSQLPETVSSWSFLPPLSLIVSDNSQSIAAVCLEVVSLDPPIVGCE